MARLNFDKDGEAFFDLVLSDRDEGFGAIAHLRVPKGMGRSSLVLHEEFNWGESPGECKSFVAKLNPQEGGQGIAFLRNDASYFSFWRRPDNTVLFEARCFTNCGEIAFRAELGATDFECFYHKLEDICRKLS